MFTVKVQGREYTFALAHMRTARHLWGTGNTVVYVNDGPRMASEVAYCSRKDEFDEERGEKEALRKFMQMMPWGREDRKKVWKAYHRMKWVRAMSDAELMEEVGW